MSANEWGGKPWKRNCERGRIAMIFFFFFSHFFRLFISDLFLLFLFFILFFLIKKGFDFLFNPIPNTKKQKIIPSNQINKIS